MINKNEKITKGKNSKRKLKKKWNFILTPRLYLLMKCYTTFGEKVKKKSSLFFFQKHELTSIKDLPKKSYTNPYLTPWNTSKIKCVIIKVNFYFLEKLQFVIFHTIGYGSWSKDWKTNFISGVAVVGYHQMVGYHFGWYPTMYDGILPFMMVSYNP